MEELAGHTRAFTGREIAEQVQSMWKMKMPRKTILQFIEKSIEGIRQDTYKEAMGEIQAQFSLFVQNMNIDDKKA